MARRKSRFWKRLRKRKLALVVAILSVAGFGLVAILPSGSEYIRINPLETNLMKARQHQAAMRGRPFRIEQQWIDLKSIPKHVVKAVLAGEDSRFFYHRGIEFSELNRALWDGVSKFRMPRGASTITQQLAKNLYLSESRTLLRKAQEAIIALKMELFLTKFRILELYLNLIEFGDGVFGIESAARYYYGVPTVQLTELQACELAAIIPNPITVFNPKLHPLRTQSRARHLQTELGNIQVPPSF